MKENIIATKQILTSFYANYDRFSEGFGQLEKLIPGVIHLSVQHSRQLQDRWNNISSINQSPDMEDCIDIPQKEISPKTASALDSFSNSNDKQVVSPDSTDSVSVNSFNKLFSEMLNKRTTLFKWRVLHTEFEDGMRNGVIDEVSSYLKKNEFVTITWLHQLYSQNQDNPDFLSGLLRIIGMLINKDDSDMLLTLVIAGLNAPSSKTQESALMVIEEWRTENCLEALKNVIYHTSWIRTYAKMVEKELKIELENAIKTDYKH